MFQNTTTSKAENSNKYLEIMPLFTLMRRVNSLLSVRMCILNCFRLCLFLLYIFNECSSVCRLADASNYTEIIEPALKMWQQLLKVKARSKKQIYLFRHDVYYSNKFILSQKECRMPSWKLCKSFKRCKILSNGTRYYYCRDGCQQTSECYNGFIPDTYLDYCYELEDGVPKVSGHRGEGIKFNQLLYIVDSRNIYLCKNSETTGYAQFCRLDGLTDRPIAGYTNLCPSNIRLDYESIRLAVLTMAHELGHVLVIYTCASLK
ncbi:Leishmanolysin-like peptidase [Schistosoma japonicum]|nr:Leishmanolysin-like peptidase [Schistosoma japonicum]